MSNIDTAVILAAGLGSRLLDKTKERPKAFLEIDGISLIERSIALLLKQGITKIIIGTGYLHEHFDRLKEKYPMIITHRNPDFATTGSMFTLYNLKHLISSPFLLLESDLLYESNALELLLLDAMDDIILASTATYSGDEVYIQRTREGFLVRVNKDKSKLVNPDCELVGINKISVSLFHKMILASEQLYTMGNRALHYEDVFVAVSEKENIFVKVIDNLAWCEIDDESHLQRALTLIYPRIANN
jgi:2-aminoethylphosphonate-pyruvate transaminase